MLKTGMLAAMWAVIFLFICLLVNVNLSTIIKYAVIGFIVGYIWEGPIQCMFRKTEILLERKLQKKKNL